MESRTTKLIPEQVHVPRTTYANKSSAGALKYSPLNERIKSAAPLELEKDFIKLNRIGVRQGVLTAHDQKNVSSNRTSTVQPNFFDSSEQQIPW